MNSKKLFVGGWVDAALKRRFIAELRRFNEEPGRPAARKLNQSQFLQMLLAEGVALRKRRAKGKATP